MRREPRIGVVVLYYRFGDGVLETIARLTSQSPAPAAIVVVDNDSRDGVCALIAERHEDVTVVDNGHNAGYGAGMNFGLRELPEVDAVLLMTHDCLLEPDSLAAMSRHLSENTETGIVGPLLGFRDRPDTVFSAGGWIDPRGSLSHHYGHLEPMEQWAGREPQQVEWLDGSCQLIRAATLDDVGPYDEDYFLYWEEVAYHARAREHGWSVWCAPSAVAYQAPGDYRTYYGVRNKLRYLARHGRRRALLRSLLGSLRQARRDRVERPAVLRAVWDFVTGYGGPEPRSLRERNR